MGIGLIFRRLVRAAVMIFLVLIVGMCAMRDPQRAGQNVRKTGDAAIDGAGKVADSGSKFLDGIINGGSR
jgi:hypothetical protein